jgi:O-antigen ligase
MKRLAIIFGYGDNKKENLFLFALQLVVFTMPAYWGYVNSWAIIFLVFVWMFTNDFSKFGYYLKTRILGWFFIGYFVWMLIEFFNSTNHQAAISDIEQKLTFILFPAILLYNDRIKCRQLRGIVRMFYWTIFILSIYMLIKAGINYYTQTPFLLDNGLDYFTYEKLAINVGIQPIYLSMYMVFALFGVIWDYFLQPKIGLTKSGKLMAFIWMFHFYMMVVLLSSRMELMIMVFLGSILIFWLEYKKESRKWFLALFKVLVLGSVTVILIGAFPVNKARYQEMIDFEKDYTQNKWGGRDIRIQKWLNTLELISENPLIGTGTGDMQDELQVVYKRNDFNLAYDLHFNPHNQYLQTWATFGLIGLFFLLGILAVSFKYSISSGNILYVFLVLLLALSMITESMLERHKGVVFFAFFLLLFGSYYLNEKVEQADS